MAYEVELYRRQVDGSWSPIEARGLESAIALTSIGYTVLLRELYEKVLGGLGEGLKRAERNAKTGVLPHPG